ncbi:MAG: hypothetical protein AB7S26_41830 [Sandaracinaceae bacterium]
MRWLLAVTVIALGVPGIACAQLGDESELDSLGGEESGSDEDSVALSDDQLAQLSLSGFREYLERIHDDGHDEGLYALLDPRLDELEGRALAADVIFWTATALGVAAVAVGIPVYTEVAAPLGPDLGLGLMIAGASTFLVGLIVQALLRPGQGDLMRLIDMHDEHLGRR